MSEKDDRMMAAVSYLLGFITGIIVYFMYKEKKNKFVLFHAIQSTITSVILTVVMVILVIPSMLISVFLGPLACLVSLLILLVAVIFLALTVFLMYKAYTGEKLKLPVIGNMAEKYAG